MPTANNKFRGKTFQATQLTNERLFGVSTKVSFYHASGQNLGPLLENKVI